MVKFFVRCMYDEEVTGGGRSLPLDQIINKFNFKFNKLILKLCNTFAAQVMFSKSLLYFKVVFQAFDYHAHTNI